MKCPRGRFWEGSRVCKRFGVQQHPALSLKLQVKLSAGDHFSSWPPPPAPLSSDQPVLSGRTRRPQARHTAMDGGLKVLMHEAGCLLQTVKEPEQGVHIPRKPPDLPGHQPERYGPAGGINTTQHLCFAWSL